MTKKKVTAIFDIGKTNKKFFLFDGDFKEVYREYIKFDEIVDEDGHPTENLEALQKWLKELFNRILEAKEYDIKAINFSTYGASFVHLDEHGEVITPLYNYTKSLNVDISDQFYKQYGPEQEFTRKTGSAKSGMLNSGLQLYWLKYKRPEVFKKIKYSLHFPQYLSYIFTGIMVSEYTSIGCHTALWDYDKKDYHHWVYKENIHKILPPIVSTETSINMNYNGKRIKIGVGIHDSSAALLPYVRSVKKSFVLVSTGTWSVSLNPFAATVLNKENTKKNCINYMRIDGSPVMASRIFLGNEYKLQVEKLLAHFKLPEDYHRTVIFDYDTYIKINKNFEYHYKWTSLIDKNMSAETKIPYNKFEDAYHHLMMELVKLQVENIKIAIGNHDIKRLYVDGGFTNNDIFVQLLSHSLQDMKLRTADSSLGSALGAAIAISDCKLNSKFLKENYSLKKHIPFIVK